MIGILFAIILITVGCIGDKKIFLVLNIINFSLLGILPFITLLYFLHISKDNGNLWSIKTIFVINLIQIFIWYIIEKKWNRSRDKQFYLTCFDRNLKGLIIRIPMILYAFFMSEVILKAFEIFKVIKLS